MVKSKKSLEKILALLFALAKKWGKKKGETLPVFRICFFSRDWEKKKPRLLKKEAQRKISAMLKERNIPFAPFASRERKKKEATKSQLVFYLMAEEDAVRSFAEDFTKTEPQIIATYTKTAE